MKLGDNMRTILSSTILILSLADFIQAQTPKNAKPLTAKPGENWTIRWNRSDDFNAEKVDWRKWHKNPEQFGAWTWDLDENVSVSEGILTITARLIQLKDTSSDQKKKPGRKSTTFTSGMLKSYATGTYGYYEARMKGAALFPGVCPAFWLYSKIDDSLVQKGEVRYSEVDIVELTQRGNQKPGNERIIDLNLHAILSNGKSGIPGRDWRRPNNALFREAQENVFTAPFDPRSDFHTYGCRVSEKEIIWYVDGKEVGRKKNEFWHRKMNVALSLGFRPPYTKFENNRLVPNQQFPTGQLPTSMQVDYVRVWELED